MDAGREPYGRVAGNRVVDLPIGTRFAFHHPPTFLSGFLLRVSGHCAKLWVGNFWVVSLRHDLRVSTSQEVCSTAVFEFSDVLQHSPLSGLSDHPVLSARDSLII